jgi:hypothetical protein
VRQTQISDQHAVQHSGRQGEQISEQHGERYGHAAIGEVESPGGGHRVDRDDRKVDTTADHQNGHTNAKYAQS